MWQQITEFFSKLTDTSDWPPRWECGNWTDFHGWLYIISDLMIWLAYFLIPMVILKYIKLETVRFRRAYILFAAFILLCGTTHFIDAVMFWSPAYRINALVRLITGIVSLATVYHLIKLLPVAMGQKTNMELEHEVAQRMKAEAALAEANQKLLESNRGLEEFAYVASHDLQEPLRKIKTFSSFMKEKSKLDETANSYLDKIVSSSERMTKLIDDVLALSSLKSDIEIKIIDPNKPIKTALNDLELKISEKNATITIEEIAKVKGNEAYLAQLFYNLIDNALKFSNDQPVIKIWGEKRHDTVTIFISDNGIGIAEEQLENIFGAFKRPHPKHLYEGSGIGLAICKKIVDIHHGTITVESKEGEGTTFIITLPAAFL